MASQVCASMESEFCTPPCSFSNSYSLRSYRIKLLQEAEAAMKRNKYRINTTNDTLADLPPKMVVDPEDTKIANIDDENGGEDPSLYLPEIAGELYHSLHVRECEIRPRSHYMYYVQKYRITSKTRDKWVDWLVGTSEIIGMQRETVYMAISYLDRYLSKKPVDSVMLGKVGVVCLMLADKYDEEEKPLGLDVFLGLTDNFITRKNFLRLEWDVLSTLDFYLTLPTTHDFLVRYLRAARGGRKTTAETTKLENMAFLISELALASYEMIHFPPSKLAASAVFLARYALVPTRKPWSATLLHYSYYKAAELQDCVLCLHRLWFRSEEWTEEIRQKYRLIKYGGVANHNMPIMKPPQEAFEG